jgi:hypothetical protein
MGKPSKNSHNQDWRWTASHSYGGNNYGNREYGDNNYGEKGYGNNNYSGKGHGGRNFGHGKGYSEAELRAANKRTAATVVSKVKSKLKRFATSMLDGDSTEEAPMAKALRQLTKSDSELTWEDEDGHDEYNHHEAPATATGAGHLGLGHRTPYLKIGNRNSR